MDPGMHNRRMFGDHAAPSSASASPFRLQGRRKTLEAWTGRTAPSKPRDKEAPDGAEVAGADGRPGRKSPFSFGLQPSYIPPPARLDASMAPPGQDTLIGVVPVGHLDREGRQDWPDLKAQARPAVLQRLAGIGITDLEAHLKFEVCATPLDWRDRLNLGCGSTHGLSHTLWQMAYLRPHNRHARWRNLYFAGASTHPGTGLPTVLVSGRLAAERAAGDLGM